MKIVAVSTCTAGIAHTYMSQEALEQECEKRYGRNPWHLWKISDNDRSSCKSRIKNHFEISDYSIRNFALHISVAITRSKDGKELELDANMEKELGTSPDIDLLLSIVNEIEKNKSSLYVKAEKPVRIIGVSSKRKFWELSWCRWSNKPPFSGIIWFFKCWLYPYDRSDRYSCSDPDHSNINIFWNKLYSSGKSGNHRYQKQSFYRIFS